MPDLAANGRRRWMTVVLISRNRARSYVKASKLPWHFKASNYLINTLSGSQKYVSFK